MLSARRPPSRLRLKRSRVDEAVYASPYGNDLLLEFATELLTQERLGKRNATDLLSVSFSSNDSVGHTYGPESPQVRDIIARTDQTIGHLLTQVDKSVGLQHTLVAFTTDHGVAPLPESLRERGLPGGRLTTSELFEPIQLALTSRFGEGKWLMAAAGSSPYLNYELIEKLARCRGGPRVRRSRGQSCACGAGIRAINSARRCPRRPIGSRILRGSTNSGPATWKSSDLLFRQARGRPMDTVQLRRAHPRILMGAVCARATTRIMSR